MKQILAAKPSITELEISYVNDAIKNGWGDKCYEYLLKFESSLCSYFNTKNAMATSSCTGALQLALAALRVGKGDEVIVPDATWIASVAPIVHCGATPVFVDVELGNWCTTAKLIEERITLKTKAIIVVHLYGNLVDMDDILELSKKYGIPVIEDAAEALGSRYKGKLAGSMGDFGIFSFHGTKTMTTGEGGALISNNDVDFERALMLNNHGRSMKEKRFFWCDEVGFKFRMSNLQAALGLAQLERLELLVKSKREIFGIYSNELSGLDFRMNIESENTFNSYWMPTIILPCEYSEESRDSVLKQLNQGHISARPFFYPVSSFPPFEAVKPKKNATTLGKLGINLPSYFDMKDEDVKRVSSLLTQKCKEISSTI